MTKTDATIGAIGLPAWVAGLELVDHHCHSVLAADPDATAFGQLLTEGPGPAPGADPFDSALGLAVRRWCAPLLELPPLAPASDYLARRAELGFAEVTRRLLGATGTGTLLIDHGFQAKDLITPVELGKLTGIAVAELVRLETVAEQIAEQLVTTRIGAAGYADAVAEEIQRRATAAVGCKSILAYRYGFDVDPARPSPAEVRPAAARWLATPERGRLIDPVLLRHVLWCGVDTGLPLQLHTGFGDPDEDLHRADPALLAGFCRATAESGTPLVLLHCYPYHRQAAWLAHVFEHVYFDVGLASTFVGPSRAGALLAEALELAPFGKLLYSSDAYGLPELYAVAAVAFRRALAEVLDGWVTDQAATEQDAHRIARMLAADNARRLYQLDRS